MVSASADAHCITDLKPVWQLFYLSATDAHLETFLFHRDNLMLVYPPIPPPTIPQSSMLSAQPPVSAYIGLHDPQPATMDSRHKEAARRHSTATNTATIRTSSSAPSGSGRGMEYRIGVMLPGGSTPRVSSLFGQAPTHPPAKFHLGLFPCIMCLSFCQM